MEQHKIRLELMESHTRVLDRKTEHKKMQFSLSYVFKYSKTIVKLLTFFFAVSKALSKIYEEEKKKKSSPSQEWWRSSVFSPRNSMIRCPHKYHIQ